MCLNQQSTGIRGAPRQDCRQRGVAGWRLPTGGQQLSQHDRHHPSGGTRWIVAFHLLLQVSCSFHHLQYSYGGHSRPFGPVGRLCLLPTLNKNMCLSMRRMCVPAASIPGLVLLLPRVRSPRCCCYWCVCGCSQRGVKLPLSLCLEAEEARWPQWKTRMPPTHGVLQLCGGHAAFSAACGV